MLAFSMSLIPYTIDPYLPAFPALAIAIGLWVFALFGISFAIIIFLRFGPGPSKI